VVDVKMNLSTKETNDWRSRSREIERAVECRKRVQAEADFCPEGLKRVQGPIKCIAIEAPRAVGLGINCVRWMMTSTVAFGQSSTVQVIRSKTNWSSTGESRSSFGASIEM
jgi:hypothetical protein